MRPANLLPSSSEISALSPGLEKVYSMPAATPRVSIITINLNDKEGLEKTILSVRNQEFRDFEHLIIDGGSTDGSLNVIEKYADGIRYSVSEKDKGIYDAQNKGIHAARGEYCQFLNAGDFLVDSKSLGRIFTNPVSEDILYGDMLIDHGAGRIEYGSSPPVLDLAFLSYESLWHCVTFIRATLFERYGRYDTSYKICADIYFFLKAIGMGNATTRHFPFPVSQFNTRGLGSDPKNKTLLANERQIMRDRHLPPLVAAMVDDYRTNNPNYRILSALGLVRILAFIRKNRSVFNFMRAFYRPFRRVRSSN